MTVVKEIQDVVSLIKDSVEITRDIVEAIQDGSAYLRRYHPEARMDLSQLLAEMHATLLGLYSATGIITDFEFTIDGADVDRQPSRFNDEVIRTRQRINESRANVKSLKGSCSKVEDLSQALSKGQFNFFERLFGQRQARASELGMRLHMLYGTDEDMIKAVMRVLDAAEVALDAVGAALRGDGAGASVKNVHAASETLHEQATALRPARDALNGISQIVQDQISSLHG
jgi:regulator of sigma D